MDEFENAFELAGYATTDALHSRLLGEMPSVIAFFFDGDEEAGEAAINAIYLQSSMRAAAEIMRENWAHATFGVLIHPLKDAATGQRLLNVWTFGYTDGSEATFSVLYLQDSEGLLVHEVNSSIKVQQAEVADVFAHVAFLDFMRGAQRHESASVVWSREVIERLLENVRSDHGLG